MALPSFFKRKTSGGEVGPAPGALPPVARRSAGKSSPTTGASGFADSRESLAITQARIQARRRLIGAAVLLLLGVLLFSLIFETKPRPLPMDLPITAAPSKVAPGVPTVQPVQTAPPVTSSRPAPPMITETAEPETAAAASPTPAAIPAIPATPEGQPAAAAAKDAATVAAAPASAPKAVAEVPTATAAKASAPAVATTSASDPAAGRFVVQVGAFADDVTVRQTRQKVEKLGLKTYTQEVNTEAGKRVRVRVGPFAAREEAAQVLNKLKGAGLPGALLAL